MRKPILLLVLLCSVVLTTYAQSPYQVKGSIVDTTSALTLKNAVVSVLRAQDSIFVDFTRAAEDGSFVFDELDTGSYILTASYPKYTDFVERFTLDSTNREVDLGEVNMLLMSELLNEVVITGRNAITIKGDTIEFDASKYTIQPNDKVEDLLAQLPGIQVDKDGNITAQGETVSKVLVDGEEFFGDDPTLVTKNIRGDMVDKVQLYDKKSDQATFTGIDDGEKTKTLNIQLKEDSKNGIFGKVDAGIGTEDLYEGQVMINSFKGSEKIAAYGTLANTGKIGLNWQDSERFGASNMNVSDGMIFISSSGSDELESFSGDYNGQGIPLARSGGAHYDNKWNDKKESINANYKIGDLEVDGDRNTISQNELPTGVMNRNSNELFNNYMFRHKADARYEVNFDSTSMLRVTIDGTLKDSRSQSDNQSATFNEAFDPLNSSSRQISNEGDTKSFNAGALWNKKLAKEGRTISIGLNQSVNRDNVIGFLKSTNDYYGENGSIDSTQIVDQQKNNRTESNVFNSNIAYTEPLSDALKLAINYRFNLNNSKSSLLSFNQNGGGYNDLDSTFSNDFKLDQMLNEVGATLNYKKDKNTLNITMSAANVNFKQIDQFSDDILNRDFINLNPRANWTYAFSNQKSFRLSYYGSTSQPSVHQIQPVRSNTDPLNISVGNPDLDPSFRHSINGGYNSYKVLSGQYFSWFFNGSMTSNAIINNTTTDEVGKSIYSYENLKRERPMNFSTYMYFGSKLKSLGLDWGGNLSYNTNSYYNIINSELNKTSSNNVSVALNISKNEKDKYSFRVYAGPSYSSNVASLQGSSSKGWGFNSSADFRLFLPGKFELASDARYSYSEATQVFAEDFERLIWNASIQKKFLKTDELILKIQANDILDQNTGFSRNAHATGFTQTDYTTISRYFMFSIIWDFNKMGNSTK